MGVRVVFLVDVASVVSGGLLHLRSFCFACTKVLLSLSGFPSSKYLKWKYVLVKDNDPVIGRLPPFVELTLNSIEKLLKELKCELQKIVAGNVKHSPVSLLSSVLADVVQNTLWDSPDILSPPRKKMLPTVDIPADPLNMVFVCSNGSRQLQHLVQEDLHACLFKRSIRVICLCGYEEKAAVYNIEGFSLFGEIPIGLSCLFGPSPQPHSVVLSHQTAAVREQRRERKKHHLIFPRQSTGRTECGISNPPDYFWLCSSTSRPLCVIQVEPVLKCSFSQSFVSSIQNYNVSEEESVHPDAFLPGTSTGNNSYAVIVGVIRGCDVRGSLLPGNCSSFSSTGLTVDSFALDDSDLLQKSPLEALRGSKQFSLEYQHICIELASQGYYLLLKVKTMFGDTGWCVLQPLQSVMGLISILKPDSANIIATSLLSSNPLGSCRNVRGQPVLEQQMKCVCYAELYCKLTQYCGIKGHRDISEEETWKIPCDSAFVAESLLPWYLFSEHHGLCTSHIKGLQKRVKGAKVIGCLLKALSLHQQKQKDNFKVIDSAEPCDGRSTASLGKVIDFITAGYKEQVKGGGECLKLQEWASSNMRKLKQMSGTSCLLPNVCKFLLHNNEQLEQKYAQGLPNYEHKMTEYLLQVLLRLEMCHLCYTQSTESEISMLSTEVTCLLRKVSLIAKPAFLGQLMKEVFLPIYSATCQKMLISVYEGLLLPMPTEWGGSYVGSPDKKDGEGSTRESSVKHNVLHTPVKTVVAHNFTRRASFQDQRQIIMPAQRTRAKKGEVKDGTDYARKVNLSQAGNHSRGITEHESDQASRKVCRSLFKRSMSLNVDIGSKRQRDEDEGVVTAKKNKVDIIVKETPVKKQVENYRRYKLKRLRSKMYAGNSVVMDVVEESPRRSFYSSKTFTEPAAASNIQSSSSVRALLLEEMASENKHTLPHSIGFEPTEPTSQCSFSSSYENENPVAEETSGVLTESPLSTEQHSSQSYPALQQPSLHSLTNDDLFEFGDSASMVAFSLSTPTKDDLLTFENALKRS